MRYLVKFYKKKSKMSFWYNFYLQLWFNYHKLFFCSLISKGKKIKAFNTFLKIKNVLKTKEDYDPSLVFLVALIKITPVVILRPFKTSGVVHGVPLPITYKKQFTFACKWVIKLLKDSFRSVSPNDVADLLVSSIYDKGLAIKRREDVYKAAYLNRHLLKFFK